MWRFWCPNVILYNKEIYLIDKTVTFKVLQFGLNQVFMWNTEHFVFIRTESVNEIHVSGTVRGSGSVRETTVNGSADRESGRGRENGKGRRRADAGRRNGTGIVWNETKRREGRKKDLFESQERKKMRRRRRSNHDHPQTCHPGELKKVHSSKLS